MITIVTTLVKIGLSNISDLNNLFVQQNENYGVEFFVRVISDWPFKQKVGIFIDCVLLKLRLRTETRLKPKV